MNSETAGFVPSPTLADIQRREQMARMILDLIKKENDEPRLGPSFTIAQAADLAHCSPSLIRVAETDGRLPPQKRNESGRRENYTLEQVNHMRDVFGTRPWRLDTDQPVILPVQSFKGGVGKSTISVHLAQYLAIQGYRVLLIDADAQASSTMLFGYTPDTDIREDETLANCMEPGDREHYRPISELRRKTHYEGLDLIAANLSLYGIEYKIAARMGGMGGNKAHVLRILRNEIESISHQYDVVIIDPPPALGMVSLSVLQAANALLIPMPPNTIDFASTTSFLAMLGETMGALEEKGLKVDYSFIQIVINRSDEHKAAHRQVVDMVNGVFGRGVMETEIRSSAEIDNCTLKQNSVYDMAKSTTNHKVRSRCVAMLNDLNAEIEKLIRAQWKATIGSVR